MVQLKQTDQYDPTQTTIPPASRRRRQVRSVSDERYNMKPNSRLTKTTGTHKDHELIGHLMDRVNALVICLAKSGHLNQEEYERCRTRLGAEHDQIEAEVRDGAARVQE